MRIAIVTVALSHGGAERVGVMLANGLSQRGHQVSLLTDFNEPVVYQVDDGVEVVDFAGKKANRLLKWCKAIKNIRSFLKEERPDAIIGIMQLCSFVSKVASIGMNIPVIMTEHNSFERPASAPLTKMGYFSKFYLNKIYPVVTVLTQADKDVIGNRLMNVVVMPNPLSLEPAPNVLLKENIILAAGRLDSWHVKGFDVLIKAFSKLVQGLRFKVQGALQPSSEELIANSGGWKLQIAGTGSEKSLNYLKGLCKENGVEDYVEFLGFQKDIEKFYQKASVFVLSSRYEGFGLVLIEAMSQGCACIACDYKGRQREILRSLTPDPSPKGEGELCHTEGSELQVQSSRFKVQGSKLPTEGCGDAELETRNSELGSRNFHIELCETGILCEPDDVDALAEAMRKMMTDDDYRESVRMKAVERSKYYSVDYIAERWEKLIRGIMPQSLC